MLSGELLSGAEAIASFEASLSGQLANICLHGSVKPPLSNGQEDTGCEKFDARLLKAIGGGELDSYSSHLHLILRDQAKSLPLLQVRYERECHVSFLQNFFKVIMQICMA
jgi:hypothetical protein